CAAQSHVRFTPNSDTDCVFRHVRFGPIADIGAVLNNGRRNEPRGVGLMTSFAQSTRREPAAGGTRSGRSLGLHSSILRSHLFRRTERKRFWAIRFGTEMHVDPAILSAMSALVGALIGGTASLVAAIYTQRFQNRLQRVAREATKREQVYADFI